MDLLQRISRQFLELYRGMAPSQRATLVVVPLIVLAGFAWLLWQPSEGNYTALSFGKVYSSEELIAAEQALLQDGLTDFHRKGQRLFVPTHQVDKYNAALLKFDATPSDLGAQLLKSYDSLGPFSTEKERQERKEAMLLQEIRRVIRAIPEVEDARVAIATSGRRTWSQKPRVTANVTVRPRAGRDLPSSLVRSIQAAVASMVPDLKAGDVTVFDLGSRLSYTGESADDPFDSKLVQRVQEFQRSYQQQIAQDLSYIPDVNVTVNVDVENLKSSVVRNQVVDPKKFAPVFSQENDVRDTMQQQPARGEAGSVANRPGSVAAAPGMERSRQFADKTAQAVNGVSFEISEKELIAAMPKAVQVSVGIPRDYYRNVAAQRKAAGEADPSQLDVAGIEKDVVANVAKSVKALIPADSPPTAVIVNSVDRVVANRPEPTLSLVDQVTDLAQKWGGAAMLVLLTLFAFVMLRRSTPALAPLPASELDPAALRRASQAEEEAAPLMNEQSKRDLVQTLVRDNPEATAAIISKWLQAAK